MLKCNAIKNNNPGGGAGAMPKYLTATEYYIDKNGMERSSSQWWGKGAAALGLSGTVDLETLDKLCQGFAPDGAKLRQNAGKKPEWVATKGFDGKPRMDAKGKPMGGYKAERIGLDLTFDAPKTVSLAWAMGTASAIPEARAKADKILDVHLRCVGVCLAVFEKHAAETRRGKAGKDVIEADGLLASLHTHFTAREHDKEGKTGEPGKGIDPHLHTHCLVQNQVFAAGRWSALESKEIFAMTMAVGQLYRNELAAGLREIGLTVVPDRQIGKDGKELKGLFKIAGISDEESAWHSQRRQQILKYMSEHVGSSAQEANLQTRKGKDEPPFPELVEMWKESFADFRRLHPELAMPEDVRELIHFPLTREQQKEQDKEAKRTVADRDREILDQLHEHKSVWSRKDLMHAIAERSTGTLNAAQVMKETSAFLVRNDLALIQPERIHADDRGKHLARRHRQVRFAEPSVLEEEREMLRAAVARKDDQSVRLDPNVVALSIAEMEKERGFKLSSEQKKAVEWVCTDTGGVAVVQGFAGTGKTTCSDAIVKSFLASGFTIRGGATAWRAAQKLEAESSIESSSIRSMLSALDRGKLKLTPKTCLVVDEAGMIGTKPLAALLEHAHRHGSKVLLQGDFLQLQAIERGSPLRSLASALGSAKLTDIRRQKKQFDRDTVKMHYDIGDEKLRSKGHNRRHGNKVLDRMEKAGQLQAFESSELALKTLAADYLADPLPARDKLIIAGTQQQVEELNQLIRTERRAHGELGRFDHTVATTDAQSGLPSSVVLADGDRIVLTGNKCELRDQDGKPITIVNGTQAIVQAVAPVGKHFQMTLRIESEIAKQDGREITISTKDYASLKLNYANTVHSSQGTGKETIYHALHRGMVDRQMQIVSLSRSKERYTSYSTLSDLYEGGLDMKTAEDRLQMNALEEGLSDKFGSSTTTKQVMADIAKAKLQKQEQERSAGKTPSKSEPQKRTASKLSPTAAAQPIEPTPPSTPKKPTLAKPSRTRKPVLTEAQTSLVQRAAKAIRQVADRVQQNRRKQVEQQRMVAIAKRRAMEQGVGRHR